MEYTVDYFINKFENIPEEMWKTYDQGRWGGPACALGHCRLSEYDAYGNGNGQGLSLLDLFFGAKIFGYDGYIMGGVGRVNNGDHPDYQQPTPKQRILAALYDIKANSAVTEANSIINSEKIPQLA